MKYSPGSGGVVKETFSRMVPENLSGSSKCLLTEAGLCETLYQVLLLLVSRTDMVGTLRTCTPVGSRVSKARASGPMLGEWC